MAQHSGITMWILPIIVNRVEKVIIVDYIVSTRISNIFYECTQEKTHLFNILEQLYKCFSI